MACRITRRTLAVENLENRQLLAADVGLIGAVPEVVTANDAPVVVVQSALPNEGPTSVIEAPFRLPEVVVQPTLPNKGAAVQLEGMTAAVDVPIAGDEIAAELKADLVDRVFADRFQQADQFDGCDNVSLPPLVSRGAEFVNARHDPDYYLPSDDHGNAVLDYLDRLDDSHGYRTADSLDEPGGDDDNSGGGSWWSSGGSWLVWRGGW